jgi:tetratricopeptide (TPR) repeat protein
MKPRFVLVSFLGLAIIAGLVFLLSNTKGTTRPQWESEFLQGLAAYERGDHVKAEQIWRNSLTKSSIPNSTTSLWLGTLMKEEGRFGEAETLLKQSLKASRINFGADSLEVATPMRQLAGVYEGEVNSAPP